MGAAFRYSAAPAGVSFLCLEERNARHGSGRVSVCEKREHGQSMVTIKGERNERKIEYTSFK